jgi:hypothetical protein
MINRAIVLFGAVGALAAAWATNEYVDDGSRPVPTYRLRGDFRLGGRARPAEPAPVPAPEAVAKGVKPAAQPAAPGTKPEAAKPAAAKPAATPPVPAGPPKPRQIADVKLPVAAHAADLTFARFHEVHVDRENMMSRHAEGAKPAPYDDFKQLGADLRKDRDLPYVIVADADVPWRQVRDMLQRGQDNYVPNAYLGVAKAGEPDVLRVLPMPQTERSDAAMPAGDTFHIVLESKEGPAPRVTAGGKLVASFPTDLAEAWNAWRKAHPDLADTSVPEKTRVVLESPRSASVAHVLLVLDVLRGLGIQSERLAGGSVVRAIK